MRTTTCALAVLLLACGSDPKPEPASPAAPASGAVAAAQPAAAAVPTGATHAWDLDDVSMLMPFPAPADLTRLLQTSSKGARGELLPASWLSRVPRPFVVNVPDDKALPALRVIAIRLDPCFQATASSPCRPMVRMSWQPFVEHGDKLSSVDAALHTFYDLSASDFAALTEELWKLREASGAKIAGAPLGVHPALAAEGTSGPFWTGVSAALLAYCGEQSLARMTSMQLGGRTNVWIFAGVEKDAAGKVAPLGIARIDSTVQLIAVHAQPPNQFDGGLFTSDLVEDKRREPAAQPALNTFLRATVKLDLRSADTTATLGKVLDDVAFLETPAPDSTSENIDCASCHIAQAARVWIGKKSPASKPTRPAFVNPGPFDLTNTSKLAGLTNQLRAFGYFQKEPVITQRVIHESAVVAARMRAGR
jgi:hypothetical protein